MGKGFQSSRSVGLRIFDEWEMPKFGQGRGFNHLQWDTPYLTVFGFGKLRYPRNA